jgi:hypothetical protein
VPYVLGKPCSQLLYAAWPDTAMCVCAIIRRHPAGAPTAAQCSWNKVPSMLLLYGNVVCRCWEVLAHLRILGSSTSTCTLSWHLLASQVNPQSVLGRNGAQVHRLRSANNARTLDSSCASTKRMHVVSAQPTLHAWWSSHLPLRRLNGAGPGLHSWLQDPVLTMPAGMHSPACRCEG